MLIALYLSRLVSWLSSVLGAETLLSKVFELGTLE
jgi:hypothetical protein